MIRAEFRLQHPLLQRALQEVPGASLEWVRNVRNEDERRAVLWGENVDDTDALKAGIAADPTCELHRVIGEADRQLFEVRFQFEEPALDVYTTIIETGAVVEHAAVDHEGWHCRYVFPDETALEQFFEECREKGLEYEIHRLNRSAEAEDDSLLTDPQQSAIRTAHDIGYFEIPREGSITEVADRLDISTTAASQRLRRGLGRLVKHELVTEQDS